MITAHVLQLMITVEDTGRDESAVLQVLIKSKDFSHSLSISLCVCVCVCVCVLQYLPSTAVNTTLRLQELRERMRPLNISAYIIPGTDAHLVHLLS